MQTRKNRKNEEDSYMRMLKLRRDINRVVMLLDLVKRREKLKKENLNLTSEIYTKRYQGEDWDGSMYQQVQVQRPAKTSLQTYPLSSWMNIAGMSDHGMPLKREKRIYRKRKHHRSGLMRNGISGLLRGERTLLPLLPDPLSSDEDRASSLGARQSDMDQEDFDGNEGPFAFKRKPGVNYLAPQEDFVADLDRPERNDAYLPVEASLDHGRTSEGLGLCRRRIGRGGRMVIDRVHSGWEPWEQADFLYCNDDSRILRPVTPEAFTFRMWDPYRGREQEVFAN